MSVWTNIEDDTITGLSYIKLTNKATFGKGNLLNSLEYKGYISDEY